MRTIQCVRAGWLMAALGACMVIGGAARADVTTERPGSILIFPKVVTTGSRDTVIQIANTGNMSDDVQCYYLNGQTCFETNFFLTLTRQQPTHWRAGTGRRVNPLDSETGLDPGAIPGLPIDYAGALICVEVDGSNNPVIRNQLKGEATIIDGSGGSTRNDVSKYNAVAIQGLSGNGDNVLNLDNSEYSACPSALSVNFPRDGSVDSVIEAMGNGGRCINDVDTGMPCNNDGDCLDTCDTGQSRVFTTLTLVPCNIDLSSFVPTQVSVSVGTTDEEEGSYSSSFVFSCWASINLTEVIPPLFTDYATAVLRPTVGGPVIGIAETFHSDSVANTASTAVNLHARGTCQGGTNDTLPCNSSDECPDGTCNATSSATIQLAPPTE